MITPEELRSLCELEADLEEQERALHPLPHMRPVSTFPLTAVEQQKIREDVESLRPLIEMAARPVKELTGAKLLATQALNALEIGMSLRDWFAGMAMSRPGYDHGSMTDSAKACYQFADAMLAERERTK
jgi:hypothetical protein